MTSEPVVNDEAQRLLALQELNLLDTPPSETFDRITRTARRLLRMAFACLSIVDRDRLWYKSVAGGPLPVVTRDGTPCAVAVDARQSLVVPDLAADIRFRDGPLVAAGVRSYAGVPLLTHSGFAIGTLCVMDTAPRPLSAEDEQALHDLGRLVMDQIDLQQVFGHADPVTRLPSRHQLLRDLEDLEQARPGDNLVAVLIDIAEPAEFSRVVSVLGVACVDDVVLATSRLIREVVGAATRLYRIDASAYLALVDEAAGAVWQDVVTELANRLMAPVWSSGVPMQVNSVFGVAPFHLGSVAPRDTIRHAISAAQDARDQAVRFSIYSLSSEAATRRRFRLLADMRVALAATDQLALAFQPRVEMATGRCVAVETLLRWQHPALGQVSPGEFIPLVEQTALARPVTEWVMDAALRQIDAWSATGRPLRASVNVSARNLEEGDFGRRLAAGLRRHGIDPAALELEVTETALVGSGSRVQRQLEEVRALGVAIAIDDFGTGYSTFSYLMRIPASTVKLDQSFIQRLPLSRRDRTLVRSMIAMAHDLGFRVVAEGVETQEIFHILAEAGCDEAQGYLICRPVPAERLDAWLRQHNGTALGHAPGVHHLAASAVKHSARP